LTGTIEALFRVNSLDLGYMEVISDVGLVGAYLVGDAPSGGARKKLAAFRAQTVDRQAQRYYAPHFIAGGGFTAAAFLANPSTTALTARIQIKGDNGTPIVPELERLILPHATMLLRSEDLGLSESNPSIVEGSLWIDTQGGPVTGGILFQDLGGGSLAGAAIQSAGYSEAFLSQVAVGIMGFFTGIASVNVSDGGAQVEAVMFDATGREVARGTRYLAPGGRFSEILEEFTGFRGQQQGGYIRISSASRLTCLGLIGTSRTLALIAAQTRGQ
jgi:hypothetical protein